MKANTRATPEQNTLGGGRPPGGRLHGLRLFSRSRGTPAAVAALVVTAACAAWWSAQPRLPLPESVGLLPVVLVAPLVAATVIGLALRQHSAELDRAAARSWRLLRPAHLAALTALAAVLLLAAAAWTPSGHEVGLLPGSAGAAGYDGYGPATALRNVLGFAGVAAGAAALLGTRLSWLPAVVWLCASGALGAVHTGPVQAAAVWQWAFQPAAQPLTWWTAAALFGGGAWLYARRGAAEPRCW